MGAKTKQLKGRIKQAVGSLTGNKRLEREGRVDRRSGETAERLNETTARAEKVIDNAANSVKDAIRTGRNARRRK